MRSSHLPRRFLARLVAAGVVVGLAGAAQAQAALTPGATRVQASFIASSDAPDAPYLAQSHGINSTSDLPSSIGFQGTDSEGAFWAVNTSYTNSPASSPALSLSGSVTGTVYSGYPLRVSGYGQATTSFRINCTPQPQCQGAIADITISGRVQTSATVSLADGQAAPAQALKAYALAEIGTDASLRPASPSLGSDNFLPSQYNVFLSNGYVLEGFSPSATDHTGIDVRQEPDVLDASLNQLGIMTGQQVLGGHLAASPSALSFTALASGVVGTIYSVSMYGELLVMSTRQGDAASISLFIDPVIAIDPAFQLANPHFQFSVEVAPGVGNVATPVPEPQGWVLLLGGLAALPCWLRRRRGA